MSTKQPITDKQLDQFASYLESQAAKYREMAKAMRDHGLGSVDMTGWPTVTERVPELLGGNTARGRGAVDKAIDAKSLQMESAQAVKQARKKRASEKN